MSAETSCIQARSPISISRKPSRAASCAPSSSSPIPTAMASASATTSPDVLGRHLADLRAAGRRALVVYVTAGHPDVDRSLELLRGLDDAGADVIEVGVPFSDPMADGPVIQASSQRALAQGMTP